MSKGALTESSLEADPAAFSSLLVRVVPLRALPALMWEPKSLASHETRSSGSPGLSLVRLSAPRIHAVVAKVTVLSWETHDPMSSRNRTVAAAASVWI
eukprot:15481673-Alexandrium_andersonii.AAC.1